MTDLHVGPNDSPDRYRLGRVVGAGSEGVLYRGVVTTASGAELEVAIKVLHPKFHARIDEWLARWNEQVELLRSLQTPGVVTVRDGFVGPTPHEAGTADPKSRSLYLVMNWVDGIPLDEWARRHVDLSPSEKLRTLLGVAAALDVMHEGVSTGGVPVLHGDIKPSNILVTPSEETVLVDFGLMRAVPSGTASAGVSGTWGYLAPEVQRDGIHSAASDRFSLGAVAYFLLTGADPPSTFDKEAIRSTLADAHRGEPDLVDHVLTMLAIEPVCRPTVLANWCAQLRESSLGVGLPNEPMRPVAPGRIKAAPVAARTPFSRVQARGLTAAVVALLLLAVAAIAKPDDEKPASRVVAQRSAAAPSTTSEAAVLAVVDVAPTVLGATACKNDKLGFQALLPEGLSEVTGKLFSSCEGFAFADSPKTIANTYAVPVMFNNTTLSANDLASSTDGTEVARRTVAIGPLQSLVVESRDDAEPQSDSALRQGGYRMVSYLVPNARGTLVGQLVSPLREKPAVYAEHKRLFEALMQSVQLVPSTCRNQTSFHCGEFFWLTEPHRDVPGTARLEAAREVTVGQRVDFTLKVEDPDGGDVIDVLCASFGEGRKLGPCVGVLGSTGGSLLDVVRARGDKPQPSGGWKAPRDHPGRATFVCTYTYEAPGTYVTQFTFTAAAAGPDIPAGHNPFRSFIRSEPVDIVVKPNEDGENDATTTQPSAPAQVASRTAPCTRA